jgi:uncharacterized membrane protein (GlpM family)
VVQLEQDMNKGKGWRNLVRRLCFMAMGISAFANPMDTFSPYNIVFGAAAGLLFGWLFRKFLRGFLGLFNSKFKKEKGKEAIRYAVDSGMLFLAPFAVMMLLAAYYLNWSDTRSFVASGIMAVGTAAAIEIGRAKGKQEIRNTIASSGVSFLFSFLWTLSYAYLSKAPSLIEGGTQLIRGILSGGGAGL